MAFGGPAEALNSHALMFSGFIQAGFECSSHKRKDGRRLDLVSSTFHDRFVKEDYERLLAAGIFTAREGLRWHLIERTPAVYDFSSALPLIRAANNSGIQVIWDLFHFGWPDHLDIFDAAWVNSFSELALRFARIWKAEASTQSFIAPINEISFLSWSGGDKGFLNPFAEGRGPELKAQLVRGAIQATHAIRSELPDARFVAPEPVIHITGDPANPDDVRSAEEYRLSMFEAWDMLAGRSRPELGGSPEMLDILGINYYGANQWRNFGETIHVGDPEYRPFHQILNEVSLRYSRPLLITETGAENCRRPGWFAYVASEVRTALSLGLPVHGICLYPILNHPGWDDDRHCHNGLWDYADEHGSREIYQPLADEIRKQEQIRTEFIKDIRHDA